jgi:hypothetical protein
VITPLLCTRRTSAALREVEVVTGRCNGKTRASIGPWLHRSTTENSTR